MKPAKDYSNKIIQDVNGFIIYPGDTIKLTDEPLFSTGGRNGLKPKVIQKPLHKWWHKLLGMKYYCLQDDKGVSWTIRLGDKFVRLLV